MTTSNNSLSSSLHTFDIDGTNPEEENNNNSDNITCHEASWSVTSHFVRKSCTLFSTLSNKEADFTENAATNVDRLRNNILSKVLFARLGAHLKQHALEAKHYTVNFIQKNMERAVTILKLHGFYQREERLKNATHTVSLFKSDMEVGEPFNHDGEEVNPKSQFENTIGAYLMKDSDRGDMIRAGSTTTSFGKRLREHLKCSKLKQDSDKTSRLYASYPHEEASEKDIQRTGIDPIGKWDDVRSYIGIGWERKNSKEIKDLFEWDSTTMCGLENNRNAGSIEMKRERMIVYLFELLLSISLEPSKNISSNPGFEMFNGSFAKARDS